MHFESLQILCDQQDAGHEVCIQLLVDNFLEEDLRPEFLMKYRKVVEEGIGVCSKCRWSSGCLNCDRSKAWPYYVRQELGMSTFEAKKKGAGKAKAKMKPVKGGGEARI
jgi:hypothetical protein